MRFRYAGVRSGGVSYGHPLMKPGPFTVGEASEYLKLAEKRFVIVDHRLRSGLIRRQVAALARKLGGEVGDDDLIAQNTFQVEYPVPVWGRFDEPYLDLPQEVLINVLRHQQGYFALYGPEGRLLPFFICVADVRARSMAQIREGHERVLRARLEDARFYFEEDQKILLRDRIKDLRSVVFHEQLGSVYDKMERIKALGVYLAGRLDPGTIQTVENAASLCKADLLTGMVREFPDLQGVMGREYARLQGEPEPDAAAIFEHYLPRSAGDPCLPKTPAGKFLAVADKLDTICGCFSIGLRPSGSEDPYALRRLGLGVIRILLDDIFSNLSLRELVGTALVPFGRLHLPGSADVLGDILVFLRERMQSFLRGRAAGAGAEDAPGWFDHTAYRSDLADAVLYRDFDNVTGAYRRIVALVVFHKRPEFEPLMIAFKRAARIVPQGFQGAVSADLFRDAAEKRLFSACRQALEQVAALMPRQQYQEVLEVLAALRGPIDEFFEKVFVMDPDPAVRANRLAILKTVCDLFWQFADFSQVIVEEQSSGKQRTSN